VTDSDRVRSDLIDRVLADLRQHGGHRGDQAAEDVELVIAALHRLGAILPVDLHLPGKLVRDRVPELIRAKGFDPVVVVAPPEEHPARLCAKLIEEVREFLDTGDVLELADVAEVLGALAAQRGMSRRALAALRQAKHNAKGGFTRMAVWRGNRPPAPSGHASGAA